MIAVWLAAWLLAGQAGTGWPQWGGPDRNFQVPGADVPSRWQSADAGVVWRRPLGDGYSSLAVAGGRLYTQAREGERELVLSLDAATGRPVWEYSYAAAIGSAYVLEQGPGPRASPLVVDGRVFTAGITGLFHALDAASGRVLWSKDLVAEFGATVLPRGYSSSAVAWKDTVIVQLGGRSALVALDMKTGRVVWGSGAFENSYSSPLLVTVDGVTQVVALAADRIVAVDPDTGRAMWEHPHPTGYGAAVAMPLWIPEHQLLFVSSAYGGGSRALHLGADNGALSVTEKWAHQRVRVHHGNAVAIDGLIIASSGDQGPAPLSAMDVETGDVLWRNRAINRANLVRVGHRLVIVDEDGHIALADVTRAGVTVVATSPILTSTAWTPPAIALPWVFVRDRKELVALRLPVERGGDRIGR